LVEVNRLAPPVTECLVNTNLPGGLYERMATTGGSIEMGGTILSFKLPQNKQQWRLIHQKPKLMRLHFLEDTLLVGTLHE
jgi:hypothetical protein